MAALGKLYLVPTILSAGTEQQVIPPQVTENLRHITHFLAEDLRTGRRYLSSLKIFASIEALDFKVLNKNTKKQELKDLFTPVFEGNDLGILSESGCPGIADPGAIAVTYAHQQGVQVIPLTGPSSILLALMASGLNGQRFAFHGYLPIDTKACCMAIKDFEKESRTKNQTQIFIETPYRNNQVLNNMLASLMPNTRLTIAQDLTGSNEFVRTLPVREWKNNKPQLPKEPAVFLFLNE